MASRASSPSPPPPPQPQLRHLNLTEYILNIYTQPFKEKPLSVEQDRAHLPVKWPHSIGKICVKNHQIRGKTEGVMASQVGVQPLIYDFCRSLRVNATISQMKRDCNINSFY